MIVNEITGFTPLDFGPTAAISGALGLFSFGCCNNHPSGTLNEISKSLFSKIWFPVGGITSIPVRSGSTYSMRFLILAALEIVVLVIFVLDENTGWSLELISSAAILSSVSKL